MAKSKSLNFSDFFEKIKNIFFEAKKKIPSKKITTFVDQKPFTSFFVALAILLALILSGNYISNLSKQEQTTTEIVKDVSVYRIGSSPKITLQGRIEKSGVYKIVAQTSGIVQSVNYKEGDEVGKGRAIVNLSSNYQGGNIPGLQSSLASKQYKNILDTYEIQKSIINDQRSIATYSAQGSDKLREISQQSLNDTNSLIDLNQNILDTFNSQLSTLESTNVGGANDADILQTKQLIAQLQSGLSQLRASSRSLGLASDSANPQSKIGDVSKNMTLKQLDIADKSIDLNKDISRIQSAIAGISASFMSPSSPRSGKVDRIYVNVGESVSSGTAIALISSDEKETSVVVSVPYDIATRISRTENSVIHFGEKSVEVLPVYVSAEATDGQLYSVIYDIPQEELLNVTNESYINVDIPVGVPDTLASIPFIPLDSVYQTQDEGYVLLAKNGKAEEKKVVLGYVYGRFVQILSGLSDNDQVIINRNVIAGENIKVN